MVKYKRTNVTAKTGVNFVRSLVESEGCLFHKIELENDLGIDAIIELAEREAPLHKRIAVQIKSGQSYYNTGSEECLIPIENHREYWVNYELPVIGIIFVPSLGRAFWVNIKPYLSRFPRASVIRFIASEANRLDSATFHTLFLPALLHEVPILSLEQALELLRSGKQDESYLGLHVLFRGFPNEFATWESMINYFIGNDPEVIPPVLIYYLSHIPWHGDIAYLGEKITQPIEDFAKELLQRFGRNEVIKLLGFIDPENGISRGAVGQSVEALVSFLPNTDQLLKSIACDPSLDLFVRECAALILAMHSAEFAIPVLKVVAASGSWYATELAEYVKHNGPVDPYG
jgi:hypothetical protein